MNTNDFANFIVSLTLLIVSAAISWLAPKLVGAVDAWALKNKQHAWAQGAAEIVRTVEQTMGGAVGAAKLAEAEDRMLNRFGIKIDSDVQRELIESAVRQMNLAEQAAAALPHADAGTLQADVAAHFAIVAQAVKDGKPAADIQTLIEQAVLQIAGTQLPAAFAATAPVTVTAPLVEVAK